MESYEARVRCKLFLETQNDRIDNKISIIDIDSQLLYSLYNERKWEYEENI